MGRNIFQFFMFFPALLYAQYSVVELDGGPIKRNLFGSYFANKDSSLQAKIFILNHPDTGIIFKNVKLSYGYSERKTNANADIKGEVTKKIVALSYRITLFDVYGDHITNLAGGELKDYQTGEFEDKGTWQSYSEDLENNLTAIVYVEKVRFSNGDVWRVNWDELHVELQKLRLSEVRDKKQG